MNKPPGNRDLPSLDLLKTFEAAARHLSFTRAGAELFLSQSAVSRQIQQLETQLGTALFLRRTRALLLTEAGQRYYRDVVQALHQLREAGAALREAGAARIVTVTAAVTFASLWLVPRLADFQQHHPDIEVRVAADNALRDLDRERIDVAVRYATRKLAGAGALRLFGERVLPVCSPAYARRHGLRAPRDLARCVLLHFADPLQPTPWLTWEAWFEAVAERAPAARGVLRFSHYDMMLRAATSGQGVALGRLPLIAAALDDGALIAPFAAARYSAGARERAYWLNAAATARERLAVRTFMQWLRAQAAAQGSE
jgi:DNA-binding transcriptional LysR family regulator